MNTKETVLHVLQEVRPDIAFESETKLIDDGILDSFDIVSIVGDLNDEFEIEISVDELLPENFNSLHAITELVERMMQDQFEKHRIKTKNPDLYRDFVLPTVSSILTKIGFQRTINRTKMDFCMSDMDDKRMR